MSYEIKQLSQEDKDAILLQHTYAQVKDFQVLEDGTSIGFFDTREEAEVGVRGWEGRDAIQDIINDKLPVLLDELNMKGSWYGIDSDEIRKMLKESV